MIYIDFETRSKADLKKVGAYKYASNPTTSVLCLAYEYNDEGVKLWTPDDPLPEFLMTLIKKGVSVEAHNAQFEYAIWNLCARRLYDFPELKWDQLHCSLAKASALSLPRDLIGLTMALDVPTKKDNAGHRIMLQLTKPRKPTKNNPEIWINDPEKFQKLYDYCMTDVLAEKQCSETMPDLSADERKVFLLDQKINERGIYCDVELCKTALLFVETFEKELIAELETLTHGVVKTAKQVQKMVTFLQTCGVQISNMQAGTVEKILAEQDLAPVPLRVLEIRQLLGKSSVSKFKKMIDMADLDNRIRGTLLYHGASTGRWSGKGIQPQNYFRGNLSDLETLFTVLESKDYSWFRTIYPDVINALSNTLRGMLRAAPGNELYAGDWSAIEARGVFWLSNCKTGLDVFARNEDIYKDMAAYIYNVSIKNVTTKQRFFGKQAILGLGFGMGAKKFRETCAGYGQTISLKEAENVVKLYRERYPEVKQFWYDVENAAIRAVELREVQTLRNLKFNRTKNYLFIKLPSGRKLAYYKPKIEIVDSPWGPKKALTFMGINSQSRKFERQQTYGGKLVENITQAVARDVMVHGMLAAEDRGFRIIMTVHDEIIAENKVGFATIKEFENALLTLPKWAEGFPSAVEAWKGLRYKK